MKTFWRVALGIGLLLGALVVLKVGCESFPESTFQLAEESRLPRWITIPPGLTRADVTVTMNLEALPYATFLLRDKNGKTLEKLYGGEKILSSGYPAYEAITVNGITEIIEHKKMEPIFYVTDDPAIWKEWRNSSASKHP